MKIYLVGGAVRDGLLGLKTKDRDWVVVGATPEQMVARNFRPVGRGFPVFLHPKTNEEYALARTERKSGHGYKGFTFYASPETSLEEDLVRRDLTINAMAQDREGNIYDPYGGQKDLENCKLRHVSSAFEEDPLRVLRVARFAARFHGGGFTIAKETFVLMSNMVASGEVKYLVAERVWQEVLRALMEPSPVVFFNTLFKCGALQGIMPLLCDFLNANSSALSALESAVVANESPMVRFACLYPPISSVSLEDLRGFCKQMKWPEIFSKRVLLINQYLPELIKAQQQEIDAASLVSLFEVTDAFRKPDQFLDILSSSYHLGKASGEKTSKVARDKLEQLLALCCSADAKPIVEQGYRGSDIGEQLRLKRIRLVSNYKCLDLKPNSVLKDSSKQV